MSPYRINPDRSQPWNDLPLLPIDRELYYTLEVLEQLTNAKAALAKLQGRSASIPNQGKACTSHWRTFSLFLQELSSDIPFLWV